MKLSKLPATFGLPISSEKGYFPRLLNTIENQDYVGVMPDSFFYSANTMSEIEREKFFNWYNENAENYIFDFKKEIVEYCRMDVADTGVPANTRRNPSNGCCSASAIWGVRLFTQNVPVSSDYQKAF